MSNAKRKSKAQAVRDYLTTNPEAEARDIAEALSKEGFKVNPRYVSEVKSRSKVTKSKSKKKSRLRQGYGAAGRG